MMKAIVTPQTSASSTPAPIQVLSSSRPLYALFALPPVLAVSQLAGSKRALKNREQSKRRSLATVVPCSLAGRLGLAAWRLARWNGGPAFLLGSRPGCRLRCHGRLGPGCCCCLLLGFRDCRLGLGQGICSSRGRGFCRGGGVLLRLPLLLLLLQPRLLGLPLAVCLLLLPLVLRQACGRGAYGAGSRRSAQIDARQVGPSAPCRRLSRHEMDPCGCWARPPSTSQAPRPALHCTHLHACPPAAPLPLPAWRRSLRPQPRPASPPCTAAACGRRPHTQPWAPQTPAAPLRCGEGWAR